MTTSARALWRDGARRLAGFGRPLGIAWLANALLAALVGLPIYGALDRHLSRSRYATAAARGFDLDWFIDLKVAASGTFSSMDLGLMVAALIVVPLSVFLAGGVLGRLRAAERPVSAAAFLADGAAHFGRFLRAFLWSTLLSGLVIWLVATQLVERALDASQFWPSDFAAIAIRLVVVIGVVWMLLWFHMAQDLARLAAVARGSRAMTVEFFRGLGVAFRHFEVLAGLYLWTLVGWGVVTAVYLVLSHFAWRAPGLTGTLVILLLTQLYMLSRIWIGMGLTAGLLTWYEGRPEATSSTP
jgi:hypothetical protein